MTEKDKKWIVTYITVIPQISHATEGPATFKNLSQWLFTSLTDLS